MDTNVSRMTLEMTATAKAKKKPDRNIFPF